MNKFNILGLIILILFYGSYFTKMLSQRRSGIKTDRMGRGSKPRKTFITEVILKATTFLTAAVQLLSIILSEKMQKLIENHLIRYTGLVIALLGVAIFISAMITMRGSWRAGVDSTQKTEIIKTGIYSFSRNPAFVGFDFFYIGEALVFSNPMNIFFAFASILMLHLQILEEEKFLPEIFGEEYLEYKKKTGRYFGNK